MQFAILPQFFSVLKLDKNNPIPSWACEGFFSITRTNEELSIVCEESLVPTELKSERDWKIMQLVGNFDFSCVGILASIAKPLAASEISIFAISTFNTDYILIKSAVLDRACDVLRENGFTFI